MIVAVIKNLFGKFWTLSKQTDTWLIWCIFGSLGSVFLAMNSVALFGTPMTLLYIVFGFCVAVPVVVSKEYELVTLKL